MFDSIMYRYSRAEYRPKKMYCCAVEVYVCTYLCCCIYQIYACEQDDAVPWNVFNYRNLESTNPKITHKYVCQYLKKYFNYSHCII